MIDGDVVVFAQVMTVIVASVAALVTIGVVSRVVWRMGSRTKPRAVARVEDDRLARLETAVDAIAIEVERIAEAQRFAAQLLADRLPARSGERVGELVSPSTARRVNTPH